MKKVFSRRPSPALIIAVIALVAALGGTAVAGGVLTTKKFKNQAVRGPLTYVSTNTDIPNTNSPNNPGVHAAATCPAGTHVVGGGIRLSDKIKEFVDDSFPTASGWAGTLYNGGTDPLPVTVVAICATVKSISGAAPAS
jgi:hypothetical protein